MAETTPTTEKSASENAENPMTAAVDMAFAPVLNAVVPAQGGVSGILKLTSKGDGYTNNYSGNSVIINSDRLILNTKTDHLFICGKAGVTITSPDSIHIDCKDDLYMFSETGEIYIGLPAGGGAKPPQPVVKQKWAATVNYDYEPLVLGYKIANLLDDILTFLRQLTVRGLQGDSRLTPENMANVDFLLARLPEILSTKAYVDGYSHPDVDPKPEISTLVEYFKVNAIPGAGVDPVTFKDDLTKAGYNVADIDKYMTENAATFAPALPVEDPVDQANKDGAVNATTENKTTT